MSWISGRNFYLCPRGTKILVLFLLSFSFGVQAGFIHAAQFQTITVSVKQDNNGPDISDRYLGLSYEISTLLPVNGRYYFDPNHQALVQAFRTLGIKSLRVGANAVDDPQVPIPQEKDIDVFFDFARAAGVKVIYSFRLKGGKPEDSARLASYIAAHDADALDCFAVGNEPDAYFKTYDDYFAQWKRHYDAILQAVPEAIFEAPSVANPGNGAWLLGIAHKLFADGHLEMVSNHYYFFGSGRDGEKDPVGTRNRFVANGIQGEYQYLYKNTGLALANEGVPYRIDELNSCYNGGAKDASDTYASALWALDCTNWWASRHLMGLNYHTGEAIQPDGSSTANNYAAFTQLPGGQEIAMRPQSYAYLAFTQGAHGRPLELDIYGDPTFNFDAYAYLDHDGSYYFTLINKSYGGGAQSASVLVTLPPGAGMGNLERMDLVQQDGHIGAKTDITLGGAAIDTKGAWAGRWKTIETSTANTLRVEVPPTTATIIHRMPGA